MRPYVEHRGEMSEFHSPEAATPFRQPESSDAQVRQIERRNVVASEGIPKKHLVVAYGTFETKQGKGNERLVVATDQGWYPSEVTSSPINTVVVLAPGEHTRVPKFAVARPCVRKPRLENQDGRIVLDGAYIEPSPSGMVGWNSSGPFPG